MLHIFMFVPTSLPPQLPISPSINQVKLVTMSNIDGFTPNHLLQQMYGTQVVDEDVEVRFSDEELELIAGSQDKETCNKESNDAGCSTNSDVIVGGTQIISLETVLQYENDHEKLIQLIKERFKAANIPITQRAAEVLSNNLRHEAPRVTKRVHRGFKVKLTEPYDGQLCFLDEGCPIKF